MINKKKIAQDIEYLKRKHSDSIRAVAKVTEIDKQSLQNYLDEITEPRSENVKKLSAAMHRNPSYYYDSQPPDSRYSQFPLLPADIDTNLLGKVGVVLGSGTIYGEALKRNIEAFYQAVQKEKTPGKTSTGAPSGVSEEAVRDIG